MSTYSFLNDYAEGCHSQVLGAIIESNASQAQPYGNDPWTQQAKARVARVCGHDELTVHLVHAGTAANLICIAASLRPHEAVIAAAGGHINAHEAGAIEATGHKIITADSIDGKLQVESIKKALSANALAPHMAKPRLVYLSHSTELGTVYTREQLAAIAECCHTEDLILMVDGARIGVATNVTSAEPDGSPPASLKDVALYSDIFWIGGTKNGALFGEAIVIPNSDIAIDFDFHLKQHGALLAKGRVLGAQFSALFGTDNCDVTLFDTLGQSANTAALDLASGIREAGYNFAVPAVSNQLFPVLPNRLIKQLRHHFAFYTWQWGETQSTVRLVTSWATEPEKVDAFIDQLHP